MVLVSFKLPSSCGVRGGKGWKKGFVRKARINKYDNNGSTLPGRA